MDIKATLTNPWVLGGIGVVAIVGGFMVMRGGGGEAAASDNNYMSGYIPPMTFSGGGGSIDAGQVPNTGATAGSTDTSIAALIASTLAQGQQQADLTKFISNNEKDVALAGYTNSLAITKETANASIQQSLANALGGIVKTFQGSYESTTSGGKTSSGFFGIGGGSNSSTTSTSFTNAVNGVKGTIGYNNGVISLDIAQTYAPANSNTLAYTPQAVAAAAAAAAPAAAAPKKGGLFN